MRIAAPACPPLDAWLIAQAPESPAGGYGERELARHTPDGTVRRAARAREGRPARGSEMDDPAT